MQAAYSPVHQTEAGQADPPPAYEHPPQVAITKTTSTKQFSGFKSNFQVFGQHQHQPAPGYGSQPLPQPSNQVHFHHHRQNHYFHYHHHH